MSAADMLTDLVSDLRFRCRALFRRAEIERELDDELRYVDCVGHGAPCWLLQESLAFVL